MDVPALDPAMVRDLDPTCCHDEVLGTLERLARSIDASIDTDAPVTTMIPLAVTSCSPNTSKTKPPACR